MTAVALGLVIAHAPTWI